MGLDLNGTTISKSGTSLIFTKTNTSLTFDNGGRLIRGGYHPIFFAVHTTGDWAASAAAGWQYKLYNAVEINQNNCFNTTNGIFTAPCTGTYLFTSTSYHYTSGVTYTHPMFAVNGSVANRVPYTTVFRMRAYNETNGYSFDADISQLYYLTAGDYVQTVIYVSSGTLNHLMYFNKFAGYFLG